MFRKNKIIENKDSEIEQLKYKNKGLEEEVKRLTKILELGCTNKEEFKMVLMKAVESIHINSGFVITDVDFDWWYLGGTRGCINLSIKSI